MAMSPRLLRPLASGFSPRQISGLALWLDATDSTTTIADQGISQWNDKSGNGRDFTQTTGNDQPTVSTLNGKRALAFNGTSAQMTRASASNSALTDATGAASFVVFKPSSDTAYSVLTLDGIPGTAHRDRFSDGFAYTATFRSPRTNIIRYLMPTNTAAILTHHVVQPVAHAIRIDGTQVRSDSLVSATTFTSWRSLSAGTHRIGVGAEQGDFFDGVIGEILIYGRGLTDAEVQRVEGYLAWKWGLQSQLPYDHPYARSFPGFGSQALPTDPDAQTYLAAVSAADGTSVEVGVANAVDDFVKGCKSDGIWDAIKASCILAGARTLAGALVPLRGSAPTNNNFAEADYNRETGLVGDGSTTYLDSNRALGDDPQNDAHISAYATTADQASAFAGALDASVNGTQIYNDIVTSYYRANSSGSVSVAGTLPTGLSGVSRSSAANIDYLRSGSVVNASNASASSSSLNIWVFARNYSTSQQFSAARIAFYSIGESLDLAALDTRVTALITAIGAAI